MNRLVKVIMDELYGILENMKTHPKSSRYRMRIFDYNNKWFIIDAIKKLSPRTNKNILKYLFRNNLIFMRRSIYYDSFEWLLSLVFDIIKGGYYEIEVN